MNLLYILPLLLLCSCNEQSGDSPWVVKGHKHESGTAVAKVHASKLPHRGFNIIWQEDGGDEWALLEVSTPSFEEKTEVQVVFISGDDERIFPCQVRKGGQVIQLSEDALLHLGELQESGRSLLIRVGPFAEEIDWKEKRDLLPSLFKTPF